MSLGEVLFVVAMMGGPVLFAAGIICVFHAIRQGAAVHPLALTALVGGIVWIVTAYWPLFARMGRKR